MTPRFSRRPTPIESTPLHEKVYLEIVRALMSGHFQPGQKLTSRKVAQELGTSEDPFIKQAAAAAFSSGKARTPSTKSSASSSSGNATTC